MSKTYKEQEERKALSKNNGKSIRYRIRLQEEQEAIRERAEALKEITRKTYREHNEYE